MLTALRCLAALLALTGLGEATAATSGPRWIAEIVDAGPVPAGERAEWARGPAGHRCIAIAAASFTIQCFDAVGEPSGSADLSRLGFTTPSEHRWVGDGQASPWLQLEGRTERMLLRIAPDASIQARIDLPPLKWLELQPVADGGVTILSAFEFSAYDAAGQRKSHATASPGEYFEEIARAPDGGYWLALLPPGGSRTPLLRRLDAAGATLQDVALPCETCDWQPLSPALLALADGSVLAAIQRGALLRVGADGTVGWQRYLDASVVRMHPWSGDRVLVQLADGRFRSIDIATGDPGWTRAANLLFPHADGAVAVVQHEDLEWSVQRISASGEVIAEKRLELRAMGYTFARGSVASVDLLGIELLAGTRPTAPDARGCQGNPVVLRIAPSEPVGELARVCEVPWAVQPTRLESGPAGVLVHATFGLAAYRWDGRVRWRYEPDPQCRPTRAYTFCPYMLDAIATPDGGAWLLEGDAEEDDYFEQVVDRIVRIAPDGTARRFELPVVPGFSDRSFLLQGDEHELRLLWTDPTSYPQSLGVIRQRDDGQVRTAQVDLGLTVYATLESAVVLEDDGLLIAYRPQGWVHCAPLLPCSNRAAVARLRADDSVAWRVQSPMEHVGQVALERNGTAWVAFEYGPQWHTVGPDGVVGPRYSSTLVEAGSGTVLYPFLGSLLQLGRTGARRMDAQGGTIASTAWTEVFPGGAAVSGRGILLTRQNAEATLPLLSHDFGPLAEFRLAGPEVPDWPYLGQYVSSAEDGRHALLRILYSSSGGRTTLLARFDEPGSPAEQQIFADGLER